LEFARLLLQKGANVVFADLSLRPEAQDLVHTYQDGTPKAIFQKTDVTDWTQLSQMFEVAKHHFGSVDIVCPGAGVYEPPFSNFWHPPGLTSASKDSPDGGRYALLDINLTHPIRVTQLAISHFLAADPPASVKNPKTVVHVSSIAGQTSPLPVPMYTATKHAINGFVRSLAPLEARLGIRVAAVAPGVVKTPLWTEHAEKMKAVGAKDAWVTPEEVAEVMVALVDKDEIGSVVGELDKGQKIPISGGRILEVSKGRVRDVQAFNDPGPGDRPGNTVSNMGELEDDVWNALGSKGWGTL
jgi:NAD(P)-dependent dehydrogenase (short-subunit alcohol dehydrogenase family)